MRLGRRARGGDAGEARPPSRTRAALRWLRRAWVGAGLLFMLYLPLSYQARGVPASATESDAVVAVHDAGGTIRFEPAGGGRGSGLLLFPGALVEPEAYAPLARAVAEAGHPVLLVRLPFLGRMARGEGERAAAVARGWAAASAPDHAGRRWVVAGHSLGGVLAAYYARAHPDATAALVLLGTTHPRDFSLAHLRQPVVKVLGTRDGVASPRAARENAGLLPPHTRWVEIEGANHSQFGYYGFQLGDGRARLSREAQQARVAALLLELLREAEEEAAAAP